MFTFEKEQYIYNIGGIKVGGSPGENPTVLAGTIFYGGHKIVEDPNKGIFDRKAAESLIQKQDEMSELTLNPTIVQIFAESEEAMVKYIDFVSEITESPFMIDSTMVSARLAGLAHSEEIGLLDRAIYNSLNIAVTQEEIDSLEEIQHECAIILAFNPKDPSIAGRRTVLEKGVEPLGKGLLPLAADLGITKPLLDTATTAIGAGAGSAAAFTFVAKTVYGHPTGSGIHNAPSSWPWLREYKKVDREAFKMCDISSNLIVQMMGADYVLYGPIGNASKVFPVVAMADVISAEALKTELGVEPVDKHPFRKLL